MGGLGIWELILILGIVLIVFGANKLPEIGGGMGKAIRNFKRATTEPDEIDVTPKEKVTEKKDDEKAE
ncbi:twin-arginine translocase TatA/TatE family subunit [Megalodesulfovibrio paquesii]